MSVAAPTLRNITEQVVSTGNVFWLVFWKRHVQITTTSPTILTTDIPFLHPDIEKLPINRPR